jgi:hypothetical protein
VIIRKKPEKLAKSGTRKKSGKPCKIRNPEKVRKKLAKSGKSGNSAFVVGCYDSS